MLVRCVQQLRRLDSGHEFENVSKMSRVGKMPRCPECLKKDPESHAELYPVYESDDWYCPTCRTRYGPTRRKTLKKKSD